MGSSWTPNSSFRSFRSFDRYCLRNSCVFLSNVDLSRIPPAWIILNSNSLDVLLGISFFEFI